jgi:hypothetical protein
MHEAGSQETKTLRRPIQGLFRPSHQRLFGATPAMVARGHELRMAVARQLALCPSSHPKDCSERHQPGLQRVLQTQPLVRRLERRSINPSSKGTSDVRRYSDNPSGHRSKRRRCARIPE